LAWHLTSFVSEYGAALVGGMIALECICIPVPGETALLSAAVYAGRTHELDIWSVFAAGALGAVLGNFLAFWIGARYGYTLLWRYGGYVHLTRERLRIGQYLFFLHGGKFIVFARFIPVLRSFAGMLAGANRMPASRFILPNVAGGIMWVGIECAAAYFLGRELRRFAAWFGIALGLCVLLAIVILVVFLQRYEKQLALAAEAALPARLNQAGSEVR
jgi:membrane protein DedA with SNARE-associated domain